MLVKLTGYAKVRYTIEVDADSVQDAINQVDCHLQGEPRETLEDMNITDAEMCSEPECKIIEEHFKIRVKGIDYCVEAEDVCDVIANDASIEEDSDEYYEAIEEKIAEVKSKLPTTVDIEVDGLEEDLDELVPDAVSEKTNWLIYGYSSYEILERN